MSKTLAVRSVWGDIPQEDIDFYNAERRRYEQEQREKREREEAENEALDEIATANEMATPPSAYDYSYIRDSETNDSLFIVRGANETLIQALNTPNPKALYDTLWYEGEVCCLFADTNVGKSIMAMQIANSIAQHQKVLYFDFELSDKQFQMRYTDESGKLYRFPENLYRVSINIDANALRTSSLEELAIAHIEKTAFESDANVIIIDNISFLCAEAEKGDIAGRMMMKLIEMKRRSNLSILVLAHTPKRSLERPLTQNDLAGSKKIINFTDSAFTIGKSAKDEQLRYIKQIKVRNGEFTYDSEEVMVCEVVKNRAFLSFHPIGRASEREHLRERSDEEFEKVGQDIQRLVDSGMSYREVASELKISYSRVQRVIEAIRRRS